MKLVPVTIWGIEFDALIEESKQLDTTIPSYPVEDGFSVSDTIINEPLTLNLTLYVTNTPVTWLYRHGTSTNRVQKICEEIEAKWMEKKLAKIVTPTAIYTDMGITSIGIAAASSPGYAKQITIEAKKVTTTSRKTVLVPSTSTKSGTTGASAGSASTENGSAEEAKNRKSILYGIAEGFNIL